MPLSPQLAVRPAAPREVVSAFYERHPYPAPRDGLSQSSPWTEADRRANSYLIWPGEPPRNDRSVLIAGCGTTQAARFAQRWPNCEVVGIDISATSLEFTSRLKQRHDLRNLEVRELAVEEARGLGRQFDQVICTGVLHHLPVPQAGLSALREVLAPGGAMSLMVYAPYGRAGVYLLQDYCRRLGVSPTSAELRDLAQSLSALPQDHPLVPLLRNAPDFRTEAGLADVLLHPQDRAYSVPELFELLGECGLRFGRWFQQAPYLPQCGAVASTPHSGRLTQLPRTDRYAAMELFRGNMLRHSFIAYRAEDAGPSDPADWTSSEWALSVPARISDAVVVTDRLPPGSAAVLINRAHTQPDLYLTLCDAGLALFNAIDGAHAAHQLPSRGGESFAAATLQRLWEHDHIVFGPAEAPRP